ncbi:MAG: DUF262 domain-containing protein [Eggerthellales bacterium]|nr:DUF262 domain-containing protein [Eggerthellales bacterium]
MQTKQIALLDFLGQPKTQFTIPPFQRVYSWEEKECGDLWDDCLKAGWRNRSHFMGVVLYAASTEGWRSCQRLNVIDGQQRLTTFTLLLTALYHHLLETGETLEGMTAEDLAARFLLVDADGQLQPKLVLTYLDRFTLFELIVGAEPSKEHSQRILDNCAYFKGRMDQPDFDLAQLWTGIRQLLVLDVSLSGDDRPQAVFESLNSKGMSLTTGDLLRSRILLYDREHPGADLFSRYWKKIWSIGNSCVPDGAKSADGPSVLVEAWIATKCRDMALIHDETQIYPFLKTLLRTTYQNDLPALLADLDSFADDFKRKDAFRETALTYRAEWVKGRMGTSISTYRLFGTAGH